MAWEELFNRDSMTEPRIEHLDIKLLVGTHITMSLANNQTASLWRTFMPRRHEVQHRKSTDYISMQVYDEARTEMFSPTTLFEKWAVVEVESLNEVPEGMEGYTLNGGLYAVFEHQGPASSAPLIMRYIFGEWLPSSNYLLDQREQFEILPEGYDPLDPKAKEEIWIPVKEKE